MGRIKRIGGKRGASLSLDAFHKLVDGSPKAGKRDQNPFELLAKIDDLEMEIPSDSKRSIGQKPPPPIVVSSNSISELHKQIIKAGVVNYTTSFSKNGIVVRIKITNDYKKVVNHLKSENVIFHTYQLEEDKTVKIVLSGLVDMTKEEVEKILNEENVKPVEIKKLSISNKKHSEQAVYLLHFPKGTVDIKVLRMIKALDHQIVSWRYYSNRSQVMQCKNCQGLGHGAANCHRPSKCIKCADNHNSSSCPVAKQSPDGVIPTHKLKCVNCGGNHTANFSGCEYLSNQTKVKREKKQKQNKPSFSNNDFPTILPNSTPSYNPFNTKTDTNPFRIRGQQNPSFSNVCAGESNKLFSSDELVAIISETFSCLKNCSTKEDQLMVIFKIVQKYCYP